MCVCWVGGSIGEMGIGLDEKDVKSRSKKQRGMLVVRQRVSSTLHMCAPHNDSIPIISPLSRSHFSPLRV